MSLSEEIHKLRELHDAGDLTDEEFAQAKARLLRDESANTANRESGNLGNDSLQAHLEHIQQDNEIARLDRQWSMEREQYLVRGRYGRTSIPTEGGSIGAGIVIIVFGIFWMIMASSIGSSMRGPSSIGFQPPGFPGASNSGPVSTIGNIFPLFGVLFIIAGIISCIVSFNKASGYKEAQRRYEEQRQDTMNRRGSGGIGRVSRD